MQCLTVTSPSPAVTPGGGGSTRQPSSTAANGPIDVHISPVATGNGSITELDLLRKIYDEICDIRRKHSDIVAEMASKKAANQQRLVEHTSKLKQLELAHRATGQRLKESSEGNTDDGELTSLTIKYQAERDELDALRRTIDDIEFLIFEADTRYDEDKEMIQQQLMEKQKALLNIENQFQQVNETSALTVSPPVVVVETPPHNTSKLTAFNESDDRLAVSLPPVEADKSECQRSPPNTYPSNVAVDSTIAEIYTLADSVMHVPENDTPTHTVLHKIDAVVVDSCDVRCNHAAEDESSRKFIRSLPSPTCTQPLPDCLPCPPGRGDRLRVDRKDRDSGSGEWSLGDGLQDGESTTSSERVMEHDDKKTEVDERIAKIKALLAAAEAEKAQLLRKQAESDDEGLRDETRERLQTRRRLEVEFDLTAKRHSDDVSLHDDNNTSGVQRRDTCRTAQSRQSRPLTRYLPVRDQPLDLLRFIEEQAGHSLERCAGDITVTSDAARGFLVKMGGRIRTWRRRWFVFDRLKRHIAYYVDSTELKRPRGTIDFKIIEDVYVFDQASSVKSPAPDLTFCLKTSKRTYYIVAPNVEVRQLWMEIVFTGAEGYKQFG